MRILSITVLLFFAALITSCQNAKQPPRLLYLQYMGEISPSFQTKIVNAVNSLNASAGNTIIALSDNGGKPLVILNMKSSTIFAHAQYLDYECLIEVDESNTTINNQSVDQIDLKYVLLHEVGHCYGYAHSTDPNNLMYADYIGTQYMSANQVNATLDRISRFLTQLSSNIY